MKLFKSNKTFFFLVLGYALLAGTFIFLPSSSFLPLSEQTFPVPKWVMALGSFFLVLIIYGGLGLVGLLLTKKIGFPGLWDKKISNKQRFLIPGLLGAGIGLLFIIIDKLLGPLTSFGPFPHPAFPASLIASITAGIGEEIIFRLFLVSFGVWLISFVIFKKRWQNVIFWIVAVFSALYFSAGHLPSVMILKGYSTPLQIPALVLGEIFVLNSVLSLPAAYLFRKNGILAAMMVHFCTDIVWHVIYGLV